MRLREPFNGLKMAEGHAMFHLAFLISSFFVVSLEYSNLWEICQGQDTLSTQAVVFIVRLAHLFVLVMKTIIHMLESH